MKSPNVFQFFPPLCISETRAVLHGLLNFCYAGFYTLFQGCIPGCGDCELGLPKYFKIPILCETNFTKIFVKMSSRKEYSVMDLDICPSFTSFMVPYSKWVCPGPGTITRNYLPINFKELNCISNFFYNSSLIRQKYYYTTMFFSVRIRRS